jgi:hypothetical protein
MENLMSEQSELPPASRKVEFYDLNKADLETFLNSPNYFANLVFYELEDEKDSDSDKCYTGDLPLNMLVIIYEICKNFSRKNTREKLEVLDLMHDHLAFYDTCCFMFHSSKFTNVRNILQDHLQYLERVEKDIKIRKSLFHLHDTIRFNRLNHMEVVSGANGFTPKETVETIVGDFKRGQECRAKMQIMINKIERECSVISPRL